MIPTKEQLAKIIGYEGSKCVRPMMILHAYKDCNIDCSCCYVRHDPKTYSAFDYGEIISDEALRKVIRTAKILHASVYTGTGEPFLHWHDFTLPKLIPLCKELEVPLILSTNGLWGSDDSIVDEVISSYDSAINFSIDWWHKVPIESLNHAIDRLADGNVKAQIFMSQITDEQHPLGHLKPHHYEDMLVHEYKLNHNGDTDQKLLFHDREGNLLRL